MKKKSFLNICQNIGKRIEFQFLEDYLMVWAFYHEYMLGLKWGKNPLHWGKRLQPDGNLKPKVMNYIVLHFQTENLTRWLFSFGRHDKILLWLHRWRD